MSKSLETQIRNVMSRQVEPEPIRESLASTIRNFGKVAPEAPLVEEKTTPGIIDTTKIAVPKELVYESSLEEIDEAIPVPVSVRSPVSPPQNFAPTPRQLTVEEEILGEMAQTIVPASRPTSVRAMSAPAIINSKPTLRTRNVTTTPVVTPPVIKEEPVTAKTQQELVQKKYKNVKEYIAAMHHRRMENQYKIIDNA